MELSSGVHEKRLNKSKSFELETSYKHVYSNYSKYIVIVKDFAGNVVISLALNLLKFLLFY